MSSSSRDVSRDREDGRSPKHQHSLSEISRTPVPMWDSSDPERAPPPLPLNPSSPVVTTRPNTSATVAAAAAALTERARESAGPNPYTSNSAANKRDPSPEKSLIRGHHHKRMQSLHNGGGNVKDLSTLLEHGSGRSPDRSPERQSSRPSVQNVSRESAERLSERSPTANAPALSTRDSSKDTPVMRPSARQPPKSILGENTPPQSATMLALQTMPSPANMDSPLANVTNSTAIVRSPQTFDALSSQILSLTGIATNLQREMAQLSRRSKDNATDLISLKEATNSRDEDIRKSLRDLVTNLSSSVTDRGLQPPSLSQGNGAFLLDNKPHASPPGVKNGKTFSLPRIPSPNSFAASLERELANSPSPYSVDGAANLALLEKILREMGTKEGQDRLISSLSELGDTTSKRSADTTRKLEEIVDFIRDNSNSRALVTSNGMPNGGSPGMRDQNKPVLDFNPPPRSGPLMMTSKDLKTGPPRGNDGRKPYSVPGAGDIVGEDIQKLLRRMKDSVTENGGMTAEVKALVRELRGEVLGMGREIGRQLQEATKGHDSGANRGDGPRKDEMARIVQSGLVELKEHMDRLMKDKRRQSASSAISKNTVDSQEVYEAVRHAMTDLQVHRDMRPGPGMQKEEILDAVREAWENYKPEIELQNFGLERDEILQCLKEGLEGSAGLNRDDIFEAVREGMEHFSPPPPMNLETEASITREEILQAVTECLENFDFPASGHHDHREEITKSDLLDAVQEGLASFDFPSRGLGVGREVDLTRTDVYDAVKAGLGEAPMSTGGLGEEVLGRLSEVIEGMRSEFKAVSDEAKQNVAANGRDTEQVLDALKDGLEHLRSDIELYVDRAADVTGKDEIIESLRDGFERLREDVETYSSKEPTPQDNGEMVGVIKEELEHLRGMIATTIVKGGSSADKDEIIDAMRAGFDDLRLDVGKTSNRPESILSSTGEILDALNDGLENLRSDVEKIVSKPVDMTVSYEILDAIKDGMAGVHADIDKLHLNKDIDRGVGSEGGEMIVAEGLKRNDIENLEVMITQLRIKVEALEVISRETTGPQQPHVSGPGLVKEDLTGLEEALRHLQAEVSDVAEQKHTEREESVRKEDIDAIETLLINTKAKIDDMVLPNAESAAKEEHVEVLDTLLRETKDAVDDLAEHIGTETAKKDDLGVMESLLRDIITGLEEAKERAATEAVNGEKVTKTDLDAIEELCIDTKTHIEQMVLPDPDTLSKKTDIAALEELVHHVGDNTERVSRTLAEQRVDGELLAEKVGEIKGFLKGLREDLKAKLDHNSDGVDAIGRLLQGLEETLGASNTVSADIKEMTETVSREFERSHTFGEGLKLDSEQKAMEVFQKLDERFDELMTKYDDAQLAADAKAKATADRESHKDGVLQDTKAVAEELKILIDTLGATVTESADKMGEDSKTVFGRLVETQSKIEDFQSEANTEHQKTREEVSKTVGAINQIQQHNSDYHPKLFNAVKDIMTIVSQHYTHSQEQAKDDKARITAAQTDHQQRPAIQASPAVEKYDDAEVHVKLDKLVNHANAVGKSFAQIDLLGQVHEQVMTTSAEISEFVAAQAKLITEDHEDKERQAEDAAVTLERRLAQKEHVEAELATLDEEKGALQEAVHALKAEKDALGSQKLRLVAEVASLETALKIRHEELETMEARADGLERRILDGVIDHSRALLISRPSKTASDMSLKRVPSHASTVTTKSNPHSGLGMALKPRQQPLRSSIVPNPAGRRILSLNQITGNVPTGAQAYTHVSEAPTDRIFNNLKRSHSVRTGSGIGSGTESLRKSSWGGRSRLSSQQHDKENESFREESEDDSDYSDTGTERRTSFSTERKSSLSTNRQSSYGTVTATLGTDTLIEESGEEEARQEAESQATALSKGGMVLYDGIADSGMGEEPATADLQADGVVWSQ
ncbi:MAG: hypothetical protein M1817_001968 [Caeruleum heppii]|nr:MAG: hypothetical protein M1817_001968 [Caeruleum heppii]